MEELISVEASVGACQNSEGPVVADYYVVAGRIISVKSADCDSVELFRRYFADWHVRPVLSADRQPDATIVVRTDSPPHAPSQVALFEVADGGLCRTDDHTYFFEKDDSVVNSGGGGPPQVDVWIGSSEQARERRALARLIFNAAMTAMRRCGLYELHAAGLVAPTGVGLLVIGPSGSGKSTLATSLTALGWQYLSDDTVLLFEDDGIVEAQALRRLFALTEQSRSPATELALKSAPTTVVPFDPFKKRFEPSVVFPRLFTERCTPRILLFSRITREPKTIARPLSAVETMTRLLRICPWACYDKPVADLHLKVLGQLTRQAKGFELLAGEDLLHDAGTASQFLIELYDSCR